MELGKNFQGLNRRRNHRNDKAAKIIAVKQEGHRVIVIPKIVVEVTYNEIQKEPQIQKPNGTTICTDHPHKRRQNTCRKLTQSTKLKKSMSGNLK